MVQLPTPVVVLPQIGRPQWQDARQVSFLVALFAASSLICLSASSLASRASTAAVQRRLRDHHADASVKVVGDREWRHDDQVAHKPDSSLENGHPKEAIGDMDHTVLCEHYPETEFQWDLLVKVLRCTCTWEGDDWSGAIGSFIVALLIMAYARHLGNTRRNSIYNGDNWLCSCTTVFAVFVGLTTGLERTCCFTWADVGGVLAVMGCCCTSMCFCTACMFAEDKPKNADGTPKEEDEDAREEEGLLCNCEQKPRTMGDSLRVTPNNSRDLSRDMSYSNVAAR